MDVADEGAALGAEFFEAVGNVLKKVVRFFGVGKTVGAHIDDGGTGLDPVCLYVSGFTHGGNDDVGAAEDIGKVARFGMADCDGGVGVHEEKGHGLAHDVAAAEDDGVGAFDLNFVAAENFHAAGGSAGDHAGAFADEGAEDYGVGGSHGFGRSHGF